MERKEIKAVAKEVTRLLLKQTDTKKVRNYEGYNLTLKQKNFLDNGYWNNWNMGKTFKIEKEWNGKTKEFEGLEMEKDGKVLKPLWVNGGSVLRVWN